VDDKSVMVVKQVAGACVIEDTLYTVVPVVAPQLPKPALDPQIQLQQNQKSPLVSAVSNASALLVSSSHVGSVSAAYLLRFAAQWCLWSRAAAYPSISPVIQLQQSQKSPLVSAVSNASALLVSLDVLGCEARSAAYSVAVTAKSHLWSRRN
jgi:hypothetical protein